MEAPTSGLVLARFGHALSELAHALGDLLGLVLAVDPPACPAAAREGCR